MKKIYGLLMILLLYIPLTKAQSDSTLINADKFLELFISGKPAAYNYFADEFKSKVSASQISGLQQQFLQKYGKFNGIVKTSKLAQNGANYVLINTSFDNANPLFTLTIDNKGLIIGFFVPKENLKDRYKDPAYANPALYEEKPITVQTNDFKLPGILTKPKNATNFPILILVHGSGPGDKDEAVGGTKIFRDLALGLAAKGIATLRYDKRTKVYGANSIKPGEVLTVKQETETDVKSAIALAKTIANVNVAQIYVLGHSLGGMLAPRIAVENNSIAGIILAAAPARPFQDISIAQNKLSASQNNIDAKTLDSAIVLINATRFKTLGNRKPDQQTIYGPASYIMDLNNYNQTATLKKYNGKVLVLQGEKDFQVSMIDFGLWQKAIENRKNAVAVSFPNLGHPFVVAGSTNTLEDYNLPQNVPIEVIDTIANWILKK